MSHYHPLYGKGEMVTVMGANSPGQSYMKDRRERLIPLNEYYDDLSRVTGRNCCALGYEVWFGQAADDYQNLPHAIAFHGRPSLESMLRETA